MAPSTLKSQWWNWVARQKIDPHLPIHGLRDSFGTWVYETYGVKQAQEWLGHSDPATTLRHYVRLTTAARAKAVAGLDEVTRAALEQAETKAAEDAQPAPDNVVGLRRPAPSGPLTADDPSRTRCVRPLLDLGPESRREGDQAHQDVDDLVEPRLVVLRLEADRRHQPGRHRREGEDGSRSRRRSPGRGRARRGAAPRAPAGGARRRPASAIAGVRASGVEQLLGLLPQPARRA